MLEVDLAAKLGMLDLVVRFAAGNGVTALFGRSGAGKTTVINAIAGLLRPDRGRIVLDGQPLLDRHLAEGRHQLRIGRFDGERIEGHATRPGSALPARAFR